MNQIQIKPISEADIEGFHSCLDAVASEQKFLGHLSAPPLKETRKWIMEAIEKGEIRLIAADGAQIVGWCDIETYEHEGFDHSGKLGMGVLKEYRRQGIGKQLLKEALAAARDRCLERVELDVYASNARAINLYKKFKFQVEGRKRRARKLDGTYDDIIVMAIIFEQ